MSNRLHEVRTCKAILAALESAVRMSRGIPAAPEPVSLARFVGDLPATGEDAANKARARLAMVLENPAAAGDSKPADLLADVDLPEGVALTEAERMALLDSFSRLVSRMAPLLDPSAALTHLLAVRAKRDAIPFDMVAVEAVHDAWRLSVRANPDAGLKHPLAPLVRVGPIEGEPDRLEAGIMPHFATERLNPAAIIVAADRDTVPSFGEHPIRPARPDGQLWLDGMGPLDHDDDVPSLMIAMIEAGGSSQPGAGAPLRDRALVEALMIASAQLRIPPGPGDLFQRIYIRGEGEKALTIRDVVQWFGWRECDYRPSREDKGLALKRALIGRNGVNAMSLPFGEHGGWLVPAGFEFSEGLRLWDRLACSVSLPVGSNVGARIHRPTLRQAGKVSALAWRLYLALAFQWDRIRHNGKVPLLTQPEVRRNDAGYLLDLNGSIIADKAGRPAKYWQHPKAVQTGNREPAPNAKLHRVYDGPGDLVRMAWPLGPPRRNHDKARNEAACVKAVRWLAGEVELKRQQIDAAAVRIERNGRATKRGNPDGFPWRIVPAWLE